MIPRPPGAAGFTLIEVLVVVAIAAILTALVVLRLGQVDTSEQAQHQLQRLGTLIEAHCQQAVFQARPRGLRVTASGYDFWQGSADGWRPLPGDGINRPRQWLGEVEPELIVEGHPVSLSGELDAPQITCQALGELTLFELVLRGQQRHWRLNGHGDGSLLVTGPN